MVLLVLWQWRPLRVRPLRVLPGVLVLDLGVVVAASMKRASKHRQQTWRRQARPPTAVVDESVVAAWGAVVPALVVHDSVVTKSGAVLAVVAARGAVLAALVVVAARGALVANLYELVAARVGLVLPPAVVAQGAVGAPPPDLAWTQLGMAPSTHGSIPHQASKHWQQRRS